MSNIFPLINKCVILKSTANTLIQRKHKNSRDVRAQLDGLLGKWKALLQEAANQGRGLEEAQDILEFNLQTDKVEAWIRDKVTYIFKS
jgi:hypothetical protein